MMHSVPPIVAFLFSFSSALAIETETIRVRAGRSWPAVKLMNEGNEKLKKHDLEGARHCYDSAIQIDPTLWTAYFNRAGVFIEQHKWGLAVQDCTTALRGGPWFAHTAVRRATANAQLGKYAAALAELDHVVRLRPSGSAYPHALNEAGWIRATCPDARYRDGQLAIRNATRACRATLFKVPACVDTLAAAYAEAGDFASAVRYQEQAMAKDASKSLRGPEARLMAYKQQRPWRQIAK